jgi:hypothetical protein
MGMKALLNKAGFSKRSGTPIYELVYVLVRIHVGSPLVILVGGTSNIIPWRPFFFLIQLVVVLI